MKYTNELEKIDTNDKAYLLGLMYSDGSVSTDGRFTRIQLDEGDKYLLEELQSKFPFFTIYHLESRKRAVTLQSNSKIVVEAFVNLGCFPRKSSDNRHRLLFPYSIDNVYYRHFIRGYFDGDGGCTLTESGKKTQKRVYIYSVSHDLLYSISELLIEIKINNSIIVTPSSGGNMDMYKLSIAVDSYNKFYNYLYEDVDLYMTRKKELFDRILLTKVFIQRKAPDCRNCNSSNTVLNGVSTYKGVKKQRFLCKDCNKCFTAPQ